MINSNAKLEALLQMLELTDESEIDCDEFWDAAAWLAEQDLQLDLDKVKRYLQHLKLCPNCSEEFALLQSCTEEDNDD